MNEEEFYAVIKLISSEEIFSKVCVCEEEEKTLLLLDDPVIFENIFIRQMGINAVRIEPWLKMADDSMVVINMDKVITITEVTDDYVISSYNRFLKNRNKDTNKTEVSENMGYLSSVSNARIILEKIYKSS